jgi:hypothetical protein
LPPPEKSVRLNVPSERASDPSKLLPLSAISVAPKFDCASPRLGLNLGIDILPYAVREEIPRGLAQQLKPSGTSDFAEHFAEVVIPRGLLDGGDRVAHTREYDIVWLRHPLRSLLPIEQRSRAGASGERRVRPRRRGISSTVARVDAQPAPVDRRSARVNGMSRRWNLYPNCTHRGPFS